VKTTKDFKPSSEKQAIIFDIYRGTTHDGPGLRTTVFFKGCPLNCLWCQNPEGTHPAPEVWYDEKLCIACLECLKSCPRHALSASPDGIRIERSLCQACGQCADTCPAEALCRVGQHYTVEELTRKVMRDADYFRAFAGGVTASGGEPLLQADFVGEFFRRLKEKSVSTALDSCAFADFSAFEKVLPFTDCVLFDVKILNEKEHQRFTGRSNKLILENLIKISRLHKRLWIRTPLIPDASANEQNIREIGRFLQQEIPDTFERWELCAFNSACDSKYRKLNRAWPFSDLAALPQTKIDRFRKIILAEKIPPEKIVFSGIITQ
jgi:pyruvate formate lyase activating enzyme